MALRLLPSVSAWTPPLMFSPLRSSPSVSGWSRYLQSAPIAVAALQPVTISLNIPSLLSDIWESVLRAVPKKKTSHMKKRHRQMAGKALKDVTSLNKCPSCGQIKRAHRLCPHCVQEIKESWKSLQTA